MTYKFNRPKSDPRFIAPTSDEILDRLDNVRLWAEQVTGNLKQTAGGDAIEYRGGMNDVEQLREAISHYHGLWYRVKKP